MVGGWSSLNLSRAGMRSNVAYARCLRKKRCHLPVYESGSKLGLFPTRVSYNAFIGSSYNHVDLIFF
jgi:hypothetical protein